MSTFRSWRAHPLAIVASLALFANPAALHASEPTGPLTAEPTVPRPSTKPCVVPLFSDTELLTHDALPFAPPPACPPPWAKVVLEADMSSLVRTNSVANLRVQMSDLDTDAHWVLFMGAPQVHDGVPSWRVERDLTDYAALFRSAGALYAELDYDWDNASPSFDQDSVHGDVRLLFYPQGPGEPAPRVPDGVYAQESTQTLPRNIVKAYVEVLAQGLDSPETTDASADRFWFACLPSASIAAYPALRNQFAPGDQWGASLSSTPLGCDGGSFREAEVWLDGDTFLGIAPIFPWLPSNVHRSFHDTLDAPVPGAHALDFIPYRLDVTPFASKLNNGVPHRLTVRVVGDASAAATHMRTEGKLLVYRDPLRAVVPGAVVIDTLSHATPSVVPSFSAASDVLQGTVATTASRKMDVVGYVDTSGGRVYSAVHTDVSFNDQQSIRVDGLVFPLFRTYRALLGLDSRVLQASVRVRGGTVFERDVSSVYYPLRLAYGMYGRLEDLSGEGDYVEIPRYATAVADQTRLQLTDQWRGATHYATALRDHFAGRHTREFVYAPGGHDIDSDWSSQRDYVFLDSLGGCYTAARLTANGVLTGAATGAGCVGGVNANAWFTRPDGSPDNLGWAP